MSRFPVKLGLLLTLPLLLACGQGAGTATKMPPIVKTKGGAEMVLLPAGEFEMGSSHGKGDDGPVHKVRIAALLMDRYEVTQEQFTELAIEPGSRFKGPKNPVEMISWTKAAEFCNARSIAEGLQPCYDQMAVCNFEADGYRLPTEAEWEYACRAGSTSDYCCGNDARRLSEVGWFAENSGKTTHPVGQKAPNAWGLHDMHGNVAEWCHDVYAKDYYAKSPAENPRGPDKGDGNVLRGGAWNSSVPALRSFARAQERPGFLDACFSQDAIGFRCVRKAPAQSAESGAKGEAGERGEQGMNSGKNAALPTAFVYDPVFLDHKVSEGFPERPERLKAIVKRLEEKKLDAQLLQLKPKPAAEEWIKRVHSAEYIARVKQICSEAGEGIKYIDTADMPVGAKSYDAALNAAGGVVVAVDAVVEGKAKNAFCAVRPPGHHALKDKAMGFCIFGNVAIAARYIQEKHKLAKVLIVDWDVHHGNGTQYASYDDPTIMHFDVHRSPFYPGSGSADETGAGKGKGFKINVPLPRGSGDKEYIEAFETKLKPAALAFKPDFVLISAGFDAHERDPLGGMKVTAEGYAELTRIVRKIAGECCSGRIISVLEGGYDLQGLADSVEAHIRALME
ncbi:MAG TPA: SUMF1/EgtB/PvdO family nonheme iron enzyme [Planctomycetota bacterium]|jgi:acetoin utilization deacetylase AcuC-like enzyme/formylglycine-generating enzyme required for sulfatase activity